MTLYLLFVNIVISPCQGLEIGILSTAPFYGRSTLKGELSCLVIVTTFIVTGLNILLLSGLSLVAGLCPVICRLCPVLPLNWLLSIFCSWSLGGILPFMIWLVPTLFTFGLSSVTRLGGLFMTSDDYIGNARVACWNVIDRRGQVVATFPTRWVADDFVIGSGCLWLYDVLPVFEEDLKEDS